MVYEYFQYFFADYEPDFNLKTILPWQKIWMIKSSFVGKHQRWRTFMPANLANFGLFSRRSAIIDCHYGRRRWQKDGWNENSITNIIFFPTFSQSGLLMHP